MLANGIISRVAESQLSKRTWVTKTETGDLNVQGGYLCRIPPFLSKSSMPYANIHNSGQLHKKTFFYFPLILGLMVLFVNAFGKTFHWGQLLLRHFCLRGSSCRQTNSFPKLLFGSLQKRTWLNLEKLFFEWSGKKKRRIPPWFTLLILDRMAKLACIFEGEMRICVHYVSSTNSGQVLCTLPPIVFNTMKK